MQKQTTTCVCLLFLCLAGLAPLQAQTAAKTKPPIYTYVAQWEVPRAQWADIAKVDEADRPILDKLVADGTLIGYGAYTNLIHQEGEPTHGTWFSATSEGNLLKALEAIYAQPGLVTAPVQGASKHWDQILTGDVYNARPGKSNDGYLTWSRWEIKPGAMRGYTTRRESASYTSTSLSRTPPPWTKPTRPSKTLSTTLPGWVTPSAGRPSARAIATSSPACASWSTSKFAYPHP
jgi:hypothetical protein